MAKKNIDMCSYILNKKFSKDFSSGYNAIEVDEFFDEVIEYIKKQNADIDALNKHIKELGEEIKSKSSEAQHLREIAKALQTNIEKLNNDGYANQRIISELSKMQQDLNDMKNKKNN